MTFSTHKDFSDDYLRLTGIVAIEGSSMDLFLGQALAIASGSSLDIAHNDEFGVDTRIKCQKLENTPGLDDEVYSALSGVKSILDDRNYAIHGHTVYTSDWSQKVSFRSRAARGKHVGPERNEEWLQELVDRISYVNGVLAEKVIGLQRETPESPEGNQ